MRLENMTARRFSESLRQCPHAGSGVHSWVMSCANLAAIAGLPPMEAEAEIIRAMARPPSPPSEVAAAIRKAYAEAVPGGVGANYTPWRGVPTKPKPLPMTAQAFIRRGDGAEEGDWWAASPVRIDWEPGPRDALAVLNALYAPNEFLFIGERYGAEVLTVREWRARIANGGPVPPHIIPNPLTGGEHPLADGKLSKRGDSAVL